MLLKQMEYYVTVVEERSFTQAADVLFISQSAVSQQMKLLEQELQTTLFDRTNRQVTLTPSGEYFYHQAKRLLKDVEKVKKDTQQVGKQRMSTLHIGYVKGYDGAALQIAIAQFSKQYPQVNVNVVNGNHEELYELLQKETIDIALNDQRRAFSEHFFNEELYDCACYVELPAYHPFALREHVTIDDMKHIPCILIASKEQQDIERAFYQDIIRIKSELIFAPTMREARLLVAANRGFLLLEGFSQSNDATFKRLPIFQEDAQIQRKYCAFWKKECTNVYIEEFAERLKEEFMKENEV